MRALLTGDSLLERREPVVSLHCRHRLHIWHRLLQKDSELNLSANYIEVGTDTYR